MTLTAGMNRALRGHGDPGVLVHLGMMRALAARGLVIARAPGQGCRLWSCWPLTPAGEAARAALEDAKRTPEEEP